MLIVAYYLSYSECSYAGDVSLHVLMLSVLMLSVVMLSVVGPKALLKPRGQNVCRKKYKRHLNKIQKSRICQNHRNHIKNRLIKGAYCLPCLVLLELLVATAKIHFEEQALVAGTKQSKQADKVGRPTRQSGLPALFCACH